MAQPNLAHLIEPVARQLWGEPNEQHSKPGEPRWGTNGSKRVEVDKGFFADFEAGVSGGTLKLIGHVLGTTDRKVQMQWLRDNGFIAGKVTDIPARREVPQVPKSPAKPTPDSKAPVSTTAAKPAKAPKLKKITEYRYNGADGHEVFRVVRFEPKTFRQARVVDGELSWSVKGVKPVPYHLPELLAAPEDALVFVVEGEKDVLSLEQHGMVATCNAAGAGKWTDAHAKHLKGRRVAVLPDNDDAGRKHAEQVRKTLRDIAAEVHVIELPGLPEKGDISDWLAAGGTADELLRLVAEARQKPVPAMPEIIGDDDEAPEKERESQADQVVKFAQGRYELLHDDQKNVYARSKATGIVCRLNSRAFRDDIYAAFFDARGKGIKAASFAEALDTLTAIGVTTGEPQQVFLRVGHHSSGYYIDLCQPGNAQAIHLSAAGWRVVQAPPVVFVRGEAMQPLPQPVAGGSLGMLWELMNVPVDARLLAVAFIIDSYRTDGPFAGLEILGEQGSGKSLTAKFIRRLIDPNACDLRGAPKSVEDIFVVAGHSHLATFENISHLHGSMQDALCILSTGGGIAKRTLYSNDEESIISVQRPWIINGISAGSMPNCMELDSQHRCVMRGRVWRILLPA